METHEQEQDIDELEALDPLQSEDRITVGNLTESLSLTKKGLQILENIRLQRRVHFFNKTRFKKNINMLRGNFAGEKTIFEPTDYFVRFYKIVYIAITLLSLRLCICLN